MTTCFEGPSAIGKTTMGKLLSNEYEVIPKVNQLYKRSANEQKYWYYQKQVERFQLCKKANRILNKKSILDGDVFQPIWYNWIYQYPKGFLTKKEIHDFYLEKIIHKEIEFPDLYIVFYIDNKELKIRKEQDKTRRRRNFEKHLKYIKPQIAYFNFLKENTKIAVEFLEYTDLYKTREKVVSLIESTSIEKQNTRDIFVKTLDWLAQNEG